MVSLRFWKEYRANRLQTLSNRERALFFMIIFIKNYQKRLVIKIVTFKEYARRVCTCFSVNYDCVSGANERK